MSDTEILQTIFQPEPCDFCPSAGPVYIDTETQGRFCLDCLVLAAEPLPEDLSPELLPNPAICGMAKTIITGQLYNMEGSKQ